MHSSETECKAEALLDGAKCQGNECSVRIHQPQKENNKSEALCACNLSGRVSSVGSFSVVTSLQLGETKAKIEARVTLERLALQLNLMKSALQTATEPRILPFIPSENTLPSRGLCLQERPNQHRDAISRT